MDLVRFALTLTRKLKFFGMRKKIEVGVGLRISDIEKGSQATTSVEHTPEVSQSKTKPSSFSCDLKKLILSSFFVKKDSSGEMKLEVDQDFKVQNLKVHVLVKSNLSRLIADVKSTVRFDKVFDWKLFAIHFKTIYWRHVYPYVCVSRELELRLARWRKFFVAIITYPMARIGVGMFRLIEPKYCKERFGPWSYVLGDSSMSLADLYLLMKNKPMSEIELFSLSMQHRIHYKFSRYAISEKVIMLRAWNPPKKGGYRLSFTAVFSEETDRFFGSVLLRDSGGDIVSYDGFTYDCFSLLEMVLHAALRGLREVDSEVICNVEIESDFKEAIVILQSCADSLPPELQNRPLLLSRKCIEIIAQMGITHIDCIPMELNQLAYCLCYDTAHAFMYDPDEKTSSEFQKEFWKDKDGQKRLILL